MDTTTFDLSTHYLVSPDQSAQYRRDGHILLRNIISEEEVEHYRPLIVGPVDDISQHRDMRIRMNDGGTLFTEATNVWRLSEAIREFVFAKRFARVAAELMGVRAVRLYHDLALIKEPGGRPTPWHKDHYYWPLATHHTVKMWLGLTDITPERGGMIYATGSHHSGSFPEVPISYSSQELFERIIHEHSIPRVTYSMKAGDATFHSGETLHSVLGNTSTERRVVLAIIYYEDGTRVMEPNHEHRRIDMAEYLPGLKGGDLAASELNPLLYESPH
jgi:ectoine hydroxylase-related dioxygenase (phytanoyl-CoA dioxygenase family)